jgi:guanylate kinase
LLPPSIDELKNRLRGRGTEDEGALNIRLANALVEMEEKDFYDYQIVNESLEDAVAKVSAVMFARS